MSDGVFFAVSPLVWENIPHFFLFFCVSFLLFSVLFSLSWIRKKYQKITTYTTLSTGEIPKISDFQFERKSFIFLKNLIAKKFAPEHSFSHSQADIIDYCHDAQLQEIWRQLEAARYEKIFLTQKEKLKIKNTLESYI